MTGFRAGSEKSVELQTSCSGLSLTASGSAIQPRGSTGSGDAGEGFRWIFGSEPNGSTGQTGPLLSLSHKNETMGTHGTRGTNYFSPEINELQRASRLRATR